MTTFLNHKLDAEIPAMRKITAQLHHICAETGAKLTPGMVVYYEDATKNYYCLNCQTVKNFLLSDEGSLKTDEDISE